MKESIPGSIYNPKKQLHKLIRHHLYFGRLERLKQLSKRLKRKKLHTVPVLAEKPKYVKYWNTNSKILKLFIHIILLTIFSLVLPFLIAKTVKEPYVTLTLITMFLGYYAYVVNMIIKS